ncbi:MAG: thioesterase family protein [Ectothiorhodospiraceae bacterium]|nr:thioesterase family protein [Ectothiorhodospiraceae bacterium]
MSQLSPPPPHRAVVRPEWIDYNRHMNLAYYVVVFDHATDDVMDWVGLDGAYRARARATTYVLETHVVYERELTLGDPVVIDTRIVDHDVKRIHCFHQMRHATEGFVAASTEILLLHVDRASTRAAPMPAPVLERLAYLQSLHRDAPLPAQVGRRVGLRAGRPGVA